MTFVLTCTNECGINPVFRAVTVAEKSRGGLFQAFRDYVSNTVSYTSNLCRSVSSIFPILKSGVPWSCFVGLVWGAFDPPVRFGVTGNLPLAKQFLELDHSLTVMFLCCSKATMTDTLQLASHSRFPDNGLVLGGHHDKCYQDFSSTRMAKKLH
jgi:hypothetical protein